MRFATLSISLMILIVTTLPLTVSAQAREETATGISARQRWDALSVEKRHELVRIHKALKSLPEKQRNQLIKRLRELPPKDSKKLVQRLREFMGSSAQHRRDVRRRRTAFQLWDFQLEPEVRKQFHALPPNKRRAFLDQQISDRMHQIVSKLPDSERKRIEKLPEGDRREMLLRRKLHQSLSLSGDAHRVMHLVRHLDRDQMNHFIETGSIETGTHPGGSRRLVEAIDQLDRGELDKIRKLLRRGRQERINRQQRQGGRGPGPQRPPRTGRADGDRGGGTDLEPRLRPQGSPRPHRRPPGSRGQLDRHRDKLGVPDHRSIEGSPDGSLDSGHFLGALDHLA